MQEAFLCPSSSTLRVGRIHGLTGSPEHEFTVLTVVPKLFKELPALAGPATCVRWENDIGPVDRGSCSVFAWLSAFSGGLGGPLPPLVDFLVQPLAQCRRDAIAAYRQGSKSPKIWQHGRSPLPHRRDARNGNNKHFLFGSPWWPFGHFWTVWWIPV